MRRASGNFPLLVIDAGNTRVKWGLHDGNGWMHLGNVMNARAKSLARVWGELPAARRAIASNVAGEVVRAALERACSQVAVPLRVITSPASQLGVVNGYATPSQLGTDRWAALVAAHAEGGGHKVVANVGTALTIDALAADGRFLGGLIVAGPSLMRESLVRSTASLRLTDGAYDDFPQRTQDAITTGSVQACVGAIERLGEAMARHGMPPERAVLSGGAAGEIAPRLSMSFSIRDNLVLDGLAAIAREP